MGKFICLYGINNLGKSTQASLLVAGLRERGKKAEYIKYPIYNLEPTGPVLNRILRDPSLKLTEFTSKQLIYTANRFQFEGTLKQMLEENDFVVAEDYVGTGIAWGVAEGVDEEYLKAVNAPLLEPDLAMLVDGERFTKAVEANHAHETNEPLVQRSKAAHLKLAAEYGWPIINANRSVDEVRAEIFSYVEKLI